MRNVDIAHDQGIVSDAGDALATGTGAAVDGRALADGHPVADFDIGNLPVEFQVLRDGTDDRARENLTVPSDADIIVNDSVGMDLGSVTDFDIIVDEGIRADLDVLADLRLGADRSQRMYFTHKVIY